MALAMAASSACGFDALGSGGVPQIGAPGTSGGSGVESSEDADAAAQTSSGIADTTGQDGVGSVTMPGDADTGVGPGETGEESTDEGTQETTGSSSMCADPPFFKEIVLAENAFVVAPMQKWTPPGVPGFAATLEDDGGTATFVWTPPCSDTYFLWARVWDLEPGPFNGGPDSLRVGLLDGGETPWNYGCQTATTFIAQWHWLRVQESLSCLFDEDVIEYSTDAGATAFVFTGIEGGTYDAASPPGELAAIARILITNDPSYVPDGND